MNCGNCRCYCGTFYVWALAWAGEENWPSGYRERERGEIKGTTQGNSDYYVVVYCNPATQPSSVIITASSVIILKITLSQNVGTETLFELITPSSLSSPWISTPWEPLWDPLASPQPRDNASLETKWIFTSLYLTFSQVAAAHFLRPISAMGVP